MILDMPNKIWKNIQKMQEYIVYGIGATCHIKKMLFFENIWTREGKQGYGENIRYILETIPRFKPDEDPKDRSYFQNYIVDFPLLPKITSIYIYIYI